LNDDREVHNRHQYRARKVQGGGGSIEITVTVVATGVVRFQHTQADYDPNDIFGQPSFAANLSAAQQINLRRFYGACNPRPMSDLVQGGGPNLQLSTMAFQCRSVDLLAGVVETIYTMRNALLHGEVDPDPQVLACYEPAYRIVMQFLKSIR
jgi:hypothetical protein